MKSPLNILHLEDDENDAALVRANLSDAGILCEIIREQTREAFEGTLSTGSIDLILSDYTLPDFDGLSALELAKSLSPDVPFIFVSATMGEERAIESLKSGATDYVLKDGLARLVPAIQRAMHEVEERAEKRQLAAQFIEAKNGGYRASGGRGGS
jgi:DNA-binding NtrC family response regulator